MRKLYLLASFCLFISVMHAQVNVNAPWTWVNGEKHIPMTTVYGTKGVTSPTNSPGGRKHHVSWKDANGKIWIFGGFGHGGNLIGYLNDLWKYDPVTNEWTWINGDNTANVTGVYGTQGVAASGNKPGARRGSVSWVDNSGNFYLFGGQGYNGTTLGRLNDLWKYDPVTNEWTWLGGSTGVNTAAVYGVQGVAAAGNWPGSRNGSTLWKDNTNNIWMFGGDGYADNTNLGRLSDLWKYNITTGEWTWLNGSTVVNSAPGSTPSARNSGHMGWVDNTGKFYLFGGNTHTTIANDPAYTFFMNMAIRNDLWRYDPATNAWSLIGTGSVARPKTREYGLTWIDASNDLWLFGGHAAFNNGIDYNDLWKYNIGTGQWTEVKAGNTSFGDHGIYGVKGAANVINRQGGRTSAIGWVDGGKLWMFGGDYYEYTQVSYRNDVWVYDPSTNIPTWLNGDTSLTVEPIYGTEGVADVLNRPGERVGAGTWVDNSGNLWLFGGEVRVFGDGPGFAFERDLLKYNITSGQWTKIPEDLLRPLAREFPATWSDASGNLWLYGGGNGNDGSYNDLWKYDPVMVQWTRLFGSGSSSGSPNGGVYGTQGVPNPANIPPGRKPAAYWKDNAGNFWFFGGDRGWGLGNRSDLWKYDLSINQWTWMHGDNTNDHAGNFGTLGVAAATNRPPARGSVSAFWKDNAGNLWIFGGGRITSSTGIPTCYNDLWKYDITTNQWTWYGGDNTTNLAGVYGTKGTAAAANKPGARMRPVSWTDANGNFWLMGGVGADATGAMGELNDVWMYSMLSGLWTWVKGDNVINQNGVYGPKGAGSASYSPGARRGAVSWKDGVGDLWIYGGLGYAEMGRDRLSDLWKISLATLAPLPVRFLEFKGNLVNNNGVLSWKTDNEENASAYIVERSLDRRNYVPIGTIAAKNIPGVHQYSFTDPNIAALGKPVVYYRLQQKDMDGKSIYTNIVALTLDRSFLVFFYPNPVLQVANVTITSDKPETIQVKVINSAGAVVKQLQWKLTSGSTSRSFNLGVLAAGTYYLDLSGETISRRISFVKQ